MRSKYDILIEQDELAQRLERVPKDSKEYDRILNMLNDLQEEVEDIEWCLSQPI